MVGEMLRPPPDYHDAVEHRRQLASGINGTIDELIEHVAVDGVGGPDVHPQYYLGRNIATYFPWKLMAVEFNGSLTIAHSFNVAGVANQGGGVYRVTLDQTTVQGNTIRDIIIPSFSVYAPDSTDGQVFISLQPGAPVGALDLYTYTLEVTGQNLFDVPYTLGVNDIVFAMGLGNVINPNHDPLPP